MNTRPVSLATLCQLLPACLLFFFGSTNSLLAKTGEQLNWYLHNSWSMPGGVSRITSHIDAASGRVQVYALEDGGNSNEIWVYDLNGSQVRTINIPRMYYGAGIKLDDNGTLFLVDRYSVMCLENDGSFKWRAGKNATETGYGSRGWGDGEFNYAQDLAIGPDANLYIVDKGNDRIQVLDKDGNYLRQFGKKVGDTAAPGDLSYPDQVTINRDGVVIVRDSSYFKTYSLEGEFLERYSNASSFSVHPNGQIFTQTYVRNEYSNGESTDFYRVWAPDLSSNRTVGRSFGKGTSFLADGSGDYVSTSGQYYKSVYRTKGLPEPNSLPHPAVHSIAQRSGTNLIDIDFEIIDADDDTATVGMIAAVNGNFDNPTQWIIPDALAEGTESKIGQPIATNQTHRVTWSVKGDWSELYGNLQVGLFAQDARRDKPVDIHFLELPLEEGNMTISRSPIKDADIVNYFQFLLATGTAGLALENGQITDGNGTALVNASLQTTSSGRKAFIDALGYRWAGIAELAYAREAATPGKTNVWDATKQVVPRNLPAKVNEYGFDVGNHGNRAWWVIKDSYLSIPNFTDYAFDNNGSQYQRFGNSVAIAGNKVVVGEGNWGEKLFVYTIASDGASVTQGETLEPTVPSGYRGEYIGRYDEALDIEGNILAVGDYSFDQTSGSWIYEIGAVYIFDLSGDSAVQTQLIMADEPSSDAYFGRSVSIFGDFLLIGADGQTVEDDRFAGAAYLFERGSDGQYAQTAKILPETSQPSAHFGQSVVVSEELLAVGAPQEDVTFGGSKMNNAGAVYLYKVGSSGSITQTDRIVSLHENNYNSFGTKVKLYGNWLVVSDTANSIHLYSVNREQGTAQLVRSIQYNNNVSSIDLDQDRLIVGFGNESVDDFWGSGSAYIYKLYDDERSILLEQLVHPDARGDDNFGASVGISGQNIVVGVPNRDLDNYRWDAGGAVFFRASE